MTSDVDFVRNHIQAIKAWLTENVRVYSTPQHITIRQIQLDRKELSGTAMLFVGDELPAVELTIKVLHQFHWDFSLAAGQSGDSLFLV